MDAVRIIVAKDAAVIDPGEMRHEECEVVSDDVTLGVNPNLFSQNADSTGTPKTRLVIGILAQATSSSH